MGVFRAIRPGEEAGTGDPLPHRAVEFAVLTTDQTNIANTTTAVTAAPIEAITSAAVGS